MNTVRRSFFVKILSNQLFYYPGIACWTASRQLRPEQMRSDWSAVRVDIMYRCLSLHAPAYQQLHAALR